MGSLPETGGWDIAAAPDMSWCADIAHDAACWPCFAKPCFNARVRAAFSHPQDGCELQRQLLGTRTSAPEAQALPALDLAALSLILLSSGGSRLPACCRHEGDVWRAAIEVPVGTELEYKLVHVPAADALPRWEDGDNHSVKVASEARPDSCPSCSGFDAPRC